MLRAAERMRSLGEKPQESGAPAAIFGSASGLAQSIQTDERYRIGVYPFIFREKPEVAMGLAACLCYLLEQYQDTRVYRCFAKIGDADDSAEISPADYQFSADDWAFDGLADNVLLEGLLLLSATGYELQIGIDLSLSASDLDREVFAYAFESLSALVTGLPAVAEDIYSQLAGEVNTKAIINYEAVDADAASLERLLEALFGWNLDVYLYLWDVDWDEVDVAEQYLEAVELCRRRPSQFAWWCLGMMAKQAMQPGISEIGEIIVTPVGRAFSSIDEASPGAAAAALGLRELGLAQQAMALLQPHLRPGAPAAVWDAMIEIRLDSGQFAEALETAQIALESGIAHACIYWRYAQLLMAAEVHSLPVDDVLLLDPAEHAERNAYHGRDRQRAKALCQRQASRLERSAIGARLYDRRRR